jgi:hypothetical protein
MKGHLHFRGVWLAVLLLSPPQSYAQRPQAQPNVLASLQAGRRALDQEAAGLKQAVAKYGSLVDNYNARVDAFNRQLDANERFGRQHSSGEAHRRNHLRYVQERERLDRQRRALNVERARLESYWQSLRRGYDQYEQHWQEHNRRVQAAIDGVRSGTLTFDENAPKRK